MTQQGGHGDSASAWSRARPIDIFSHILALRMALETALGLLRRSAYAPHMKDMLDEWQSLLRALPPDRPQT